VGQKRGALDWWWRVQRKTETVQVLVRWAQLPALVAGTGWESLLVQALAVQAATEALTTWPYQKQRQ